MGQQRGPPLGLLGASLLGLIASSVHAQTTGAIAGRASDSSGVPLPGVTIEASSSHLQGTRVAVTGSDGSYRLPALPPGVYALRASFSGLTGVEKTATVMLDTTSIVNMTLRLSLREEVLVSGETLRIDTTSTTTGTSYTDNVIAHLPVDRNYAEIVRSNPGVSSDLGETQGRALGLTVYGATSAENQWIIDGVNTTSVQKGIQGKAINNEFVEEVEVKTGGYPAEYGGALGGVVNVITKSGGNTFHGDGFFYYDSNGTAARQVFTDSDSVTTRMRQADYRRFDYGADLGGYLVKDRLWFFAAYDRVDLNAHVSRVVPTPYVSADDRFPLDATDNLYSGKLTWNVASTRSIVGTIFADPSTSSGASGVDPRQDPRLPRFEDTTIVNPDRSTWYSSRRVGGTDYSLRATQLLGSAGLFTLQASHHQDRNSLTAPDEIRTIDLRCQDGTPENPCSPLSVPSFVTGGFGIIDGPLDHNVSRRDQFRGDLTRYMGSHELKAGGDYTYGRGDAMFSVSGGQEVAILNDYGTTYYVHDFPVRSVHDSTPVAGVHIRAKTQELGAYLQDSWKPTAGLTVNLGLRWDAEHLLNYQGVAAFSLNNEWQPRLGVVWDPWRNGRTKLYAFAGRFYYALPTEGTGWAFHNFAVVFAYNFDPLSLAQDPGVPGHPTPFCWAGCGNSADSTDPFDNVDRNLKGMHQDEYAVGIERMLDSTMTVGLKATYRRLGNAVEDRCDFDYNSPETNYQGCAIINPGSGERFARGDAPVCNGFGDVGAGQCFPTGPATPPARRLYRGIELLARKSVGDKLWLQTSYVYSSLRGNYDGGINETFQNTTPGLNQDFDWPQYWHNSYGRLFLDRPHRFRFDGFWTTPLGPSIGLQAVAESGAPLDSLGYFNFGSNVYLVPRGSAGRLPTQWEANLTLSYPIALGPATVTLQGYVYNLFNNQIATTRENRWTLTPPTDYPATIYDPNQEPHYDQYGKIMGRQTPRFFRAAIRVSF